MNLSPVQMAAWGVSLGMDGVFLVASAVVAGLLLRRNGFAAALVALVAALAFGKMGLGIAVRLSMQTAMDWLMAEGLYDAVVWFFAAEDLIFSVAGAMQWALLAAAAFVGRDAPAGD
ncbi:MAG: hypothetical protein H6737_31995 [Alphaproteobacteria bacterium]|nr:hypothetical protein [Alphaproteobacteria bacterium]